MKLLCGNGSRPSVNTLVPARDLLDAQTELALARPERPISPDPAPIPRALLASDLVE